MGICQNKKDEEFVKKKQASVSEESWRFHETKQQKTKVLLTWALRSRDQALFLPLLCNSRWQRNGPKKARLWKKKGEITRFYHQRTTGRNLWAPTGFNLRLPFIYLPAIYSYPFLEECRHRDLPACGHREKGQHHRCFGSCLHACPHCSFQDAMRIGTQPQDLNSELRLSQTVWQCSIQPVPPTPQNKTSNNPSAIATCTVLNNLKRTHTEHEESTSAALYRLCRQQTLKLVQK